MKSIDEKNTQFMVRLPYGAYKKLCERANEAGITVSKYCGAHLTALVKEEHNHANK